MSRINRFYLKQFALNALNNGVFGSAQAGSKILSNNPDTIQSLSAWDNGWNDAVISGQKLPPLEEMQSLQFVQTRAIAYLMQQGIAEYNSDTVYYENSLVMKAGTFELWGSIDDDNQGNPLVEGAYWTLLQDFSNPDTGPLNNYVATSNPTANDDSGDGYSVGSQWVNTTSNTIFFCTDASSGAAIWRPAGLSVTKQIFTTSGTYTPTSGMLYCDVYCLGAGGGGGGTAAAGAGDQGAGGGGGAGGSSEKRLLASDIGSSKPVTIGTGGTGGAAGANAGNAGGDTSLGTLCIAKGGSGGGGATPGASIAPLGGLGGVAGTGDVTGTGDPGGAGQSGITLQVTVRSGAGASTAWGGGGRALSPQGSGFINGENGTGYGSGGSGAGNGAGGSSAPGGNGTNGLIIITEYCLQ